MRAKKEEMCLCFFFQAEDGIRDTSVTGVQTCALPISMIDAVTPEWFLTNRGGIPRQRPRIVMDEFIRCFTPKTVSGCCRDRSEERRVGKECRSRWSLEH